MPYFSVYKFLTEYTNISDFSQGPLFLCYVLSIIAGAVYCKKNSIQFSFLRGVVVSIG